MLTGAVTHKVRRAAMTSEYKLPTANAAKQHLTGKSSSFARNVATWVTVATSVSTILGVPFREYADQAVVAVCIDKRQMWNVAHQKRLREGLLGAMSSRFINPATNAPVALTLAL
jgi:hypothetical protein